MATILIIEDNATLREGVAQVVSRMGHEPITAPGGRQGIELFKRQEPDLVISDLKMDGMDGMEVLRAVRELNPEVLVMIMTAFGSIERAVDAMKEGAFDFIPKPFPPDLLRTKIAKALEVRDQRLKAERLSQENDMLRADAQQSYTMDIVGQAEPMQRIFQMVRKIAATDSTVYVHGESGTGKELIAHAIHKNSHRKDGPFIKVNCSALAESLLESELFGHEKGSFTGALKRKLGRFELADGGTLFLDEIGDISAATQLKLLRVLQERQIERVGGEETVKVDVRVVTATNKDLKAEVEAGRFREDLFYRLHIIPLSLPALRERREDIPLLVDHFLHKLIARTRAQVSGLSPEAMQLLMQYAWPGNVRELENVIEHAMVFAEGDLIHARDLPPVISGHNTDDLLHIPEGDRALPDILDALENQLILRAFKKAKGVKTETARLLGIKPSALYYKLEKYGIDDAVLEG
jgi:two-component system, NtrC family, response regulator HydG